MAVPPTGHSKLGLEMDEGRVWVPNQTHGCLPGSGGVRIPNLCIPTSTSIKKSVVFNCNEWKYYKIWANLIGCFFTVLGFNGWKYYKIWHYTYTYTSIYTYIHRSVLKQLGIPGNTGNTLCIRPWCSSFAFAPPTNQGSFYTLALALCFCFSTRIP